MNDGPGLSAWDLANARCAGIDAAARERLERELARDTDPEFRRDMESRAATWAKSRQARSAARLSATPYWPSWAFHPARCPEGKCPGCHGPISTRANTGFCGGCGKRAGRHLGRIVLAWRLYRAGEWKP